ncbi:hypothetical protein [Frisingicoccus sp.]|uniref:hypothetical protein n=1 Tax=Frisingicoccus sp. TaxID=1918627 RepID=UPI003AB27B6B
MKVRICPLCDQPMKKAHRCDSCNSFIWKPEYVDIHYNTDTVHGDDCSYDSQAHDYKYRDDGSVTMMPSRKKRKARAAESSEWTADDSTTADTYKKYKKTYKISGKTYSDGTVPERRGASGKAKLIIIIVVVFSIISAAAEVIGTLEKKMTADISGIFSDDPIRATEDYFAEDEGDDWAASDEDIGRVEYSDEEVAALGSECTGFEHMDITVDEFMAVLEPELSKLGMDTKSFSDSSNNYSYDYGDDDFYSYFVQERMYDMDTDIGYYYSVAWDTFSKRLHEVSYNVYDSERADEFFVSTMKALTGDGESFREEFQKQRGIAEKDEYVFFDTDGYEVYINYYEGYDNSYYISITKTM